VLERWWLSAVSRWWARDGAEALELDGRSAGRRRHLLGDALDDP
jgi:hypothetical protein